MLEKAGFDGIWWSNPGRMTKAGKLALTSNAISVFDPAKKVEIDMDLMREVGAHQVKKPEKSTLETIVAAM